MDPRRSGSDTSSYYSGSSGSSVWSTSESVAFVYTDDPYWSWYDGYDGVRGAVTRKIDRKDDPRMRVAAHILRGPFASHKSKKHREHRDYRDSDSRSMSSSSSSSSRRSRHRGPSSPLPPRPRGYMGSPHGHEFRGPPPPPPPPPAMAGPPPPMGFEAGFIQIGGGGPPPPPDPVWGSDAEHYEGGDEAEVWE
ncbi:hypothetical protein F5Y16DRAFT_399369 [Xylariaceae sp. FL0255]|nr:hypothetical protein F5Y16DRAFT_399369 [Xylariaceae sp. FL0255]